MPCSECVVERFCSFDCLHEAQRSYHCFDCGGVVAEKGVATHSLAFLEKLLTDVSTYHILIYLMSINIYDAP